MFHSKLRTHLRGELYIYAVIQRRRCSSKSAVGLLFDGEPCCNLVITGPTETRRGYLSNTSPTTDFDAGNVNVI